MLAVHQVSEALEHMPSLLVLDDLDLLCPAPSADPGAPPQPPHADALVQWLTDVLDALRPPDGLPYPGEILFVETLPRQALLVKSQKLSPDWKEVRGFLLQAYIAVFTAMAMRADNLTTCIASEMLPG